MYNYMTRKVRSKQIFTSWDLPKVYFRDKTAIYFHHKTSEKEELEVECLLL